MIILAALLAVAIASIGYLYPLAMRPLVGPGDGPLVDRARRDALQAKMLAAASKNFPIVMHWGDRDCVELRSTQADGTGSYFVCYSAQTGKLLQEGMNIGF
uniref:hypothetical protein n=1 Tax=Sphingomonas bacterium TaxID=1895847 RepID=UPI00261D7E92|nr:hypothetical protein [Sphingomonas bacterium]